MLIQIKCQNCGSNIKVDSNNKKYICEHCGAEFIIEETVNNFQTVNEYHTTQNIVKHVYGKDVMDATDFIQNADVFVSLGEFNKAEDLYNKAININPADWRGWFGIVKVRTLNFSKIEDKTHLEFLSKAKKVATKAQLLEIQKQYKEFSLKVEKERQRKEELQHEEYLRRQEFLKQQKIEEDRKKKKKKTSIISIVIVLAVVLAVFVPITITKQKADLEARNGLILEEKEDYYIVTGIEEFNEHIIIPSAYKGKEVKVISPEAFANTNIKSVEIPDSVTSIGSAAFSGCPVESATLPAWAISYLPKNSLITVVINAGTSIDSYAFSSCNKLTSIEIPDSVTSIGSNAFPDGDILQYNIKDGLKYLGNSNNSYLYLAGTTSTSITSASIDSGCKLIGSNAFSYCSLLADIEIPDSATSIGSSAFSYCSSLTSITIGNSVTNIDSFAFNGCHKLVEVVNRSPYIFVEKGGWYGDIGAFALIVYNSDSGTTESQLINDNGYISYTDGTERILVNYTGNETDLTLPSYITQINNYAFSGCSSLTSVTIGNSVISIGHDAFSNCSSLASVVIGASATSIGSYAFSGCSSLTSVVIGESVTNIGVATFFGCSSLTSIIFEDASTWYRISALDNNAIENWQNKKWGSQESVTSASDNAVTFKLAYNYYWYKL